MTKELKIILTEQELKLLSQSAAQQFRRTQDQARFLIVSALQGQNKSDAPTYQSESVAFATSNQ